MYTSKCVVLSLHGNEMIALFLGAGIFVSTFWGEPFNAGTHVLGNLAVVAFLSSSWNCYSEFRYPVHLPLVYACVTMGACVRSPGAGTRTLLSFSILCLSRISYFPESLF